MHFETMQHTFKQLFSNPAEATFFAPGRINLIGEHIDYNGGLVFPCPITYGTYALVSKRKDRKICAYSMNFEDLGTIEFSLDDLTYSKAHNWVNYIKGVVKFLLENGHAIDHGLNLVVYGDIPNGAGLSSSASLEMLSVIIFKETFNLNISPVEAALLGKSVENHYIGVNSGIMDQFAISLGKKDKAILLNCDTLDFKYVDFVLENYSIVIMNTNKRRELADSKYNERRSECDSALEKLQTCFKINHLCDLSLEQLSNCPSDLLTPIEFKRVRHAVSENERVKSAATALSSGDLIAFGKLLNASHLSLRDDYEVTGIELDTLVAAALEQEGVLGARMTGAGFGGCSLALVENSKVNIFIEKTQSAYRQTIGYDASFYIATIGNGPIKLS